MLASNKCKPSYNVKHVSRPWQIYAWSFLYYAMPAIPGNVIIMKLYYAHITLLDKFSKKPSKIMWKVPGMLLSKGHENGKPMKYLWKGAKYNQWNYHERPMKLMAWTRSMKKPWNFFPSNEKLWKLLPSNQPY